MIYTLPLPVGLLYLYIIYECTNGSIITMTCRYKEFGHP